jgi:hypothetical protein
MHHLSWILLLVFGIFPARLPGTSISRSDPERLLNALEDARLEMNRVFPVRDLRLRRGAVTFNFERGRLMFAEPIGGVVTGLLFWGKGTMLAMPPGSVEKQQLNLFAGAPTLNEHFTEVLMRFTDDTYSELMSQISGAAEQEQAESLPELGSFQDLLKGRTLTNYRILADLLNGRTTPMLSARVVGRSLGMIDFGYDRRKTEDTYLGQFTQANGRSNYAHWCSFSSDSPGQTEVLFPRMIDVQRYRVETSIDRNDRLAGVTEVEYRGEIAGEWMLTFDLSRFLKVSKVEDSTGRTLRFFQNSDMNDQEISRLGHDVVLVLLPEATRQGELKTLRFTYEGDVISRVGNGVFYVGSRGSWYPNLGATDRAVYTLTFRHPKVFTIVATGDLVKQWEDGDERLSIWNCDTEIPVAGFNYGDYQITRLTAGDVQVEVYANRGIENIHQEVIARMEYLRQLQLRPAVNPRRRFPDVVNEPLPAGPNLLDFDTTRFARDIATRVAGTIGVYEQILGKFPYRKLAVSQIPGRFSQGWPSLLYASSLSFLSRAQREHIGLARDQEAHFLECLHAHEVAHQWWGNLLGWKSYHDLWMFEGFSNYLGYLSMQARYPNGRQFSDLLRFGRDKLLAKNSEGVSIESAGPVWLGPRLNSSKFPEAYATIIYEKGAWIFHMLRYLFSDPATGSDEAFRELMGDFVKTYGGGLASTADLQKMAEKHMSKELDLEGNRKLDWFFDQWVYGTGIPVYQLQYSVSLQKNGTFLLKGKIKQDNVSEYFMMPVDVFGYLEPGNASKIGRVIVSGNETTFRLSLKKKPRRVTLDENQQILSENRTL